MPHMRADDSCVRISGAAVSPPAFSSRVRPRARLLSTR